MNNCHLGLSAYLLVFILLGLPNSSLGQNRSDSVMTKLKPEPISKINNPSIYEVRKMVKDFSRLLFSEMNPSEAYTTYIFVGDLTREELGYFDRDFLKINKDIPLSSIPRYLSLVAWRDFAKAYFIFGHTKLSKDYTQQIRRGLESENEEFERILSSSLKENNLSRSDFDAFFEEDGKTVTDSQIVQLEKLYNDVMKAVKKIINMSTYSNNIRLLNRNWEIRRNSIGKEIVYSVTLRPIMSFIVGRKANSIKIIEFPQYVD